jgi:hypothetical protein
MSPCKVNINGKEYTCPKAKKSFQDEWPIIDGGKVRAFKPACPKCALLKRAEKLWEYKINEQYPKDWVYGVTQPYENPILHIQKKYNDYKSDGYDYYGYIAGYEDNAGKVDLRFRLMESVDSFEEACEWITCRGPFRIPKSVGELDSTGHYQPLESVYALPETPPIQHLSGFKDYMLEVKGILLKDDDIENKTQPRSDSVEDRKDTVCVAMLTYSGASGKDNGGNGAFS